MAGHCLAKALAPAFLSVALVPGESQGWGSLVGCRLWGRTELDTTEATQQQQQQQHVTGLLGGTDSRPSSQ